MGTRTRKKDRIRSNPHKFNFLISSGGKDGTELTYKDLKRKAIVLGMPFTEAAGCSVIGLVHYIKTTDKSPDLDRINEYDRWLVAHLKEIGYSDDDPLMNSRLRLGYLGDEIDEETGQVIRKKRIPGINKKVAKKKREKDEDGHIKGTKKSYTWECAKKGFDLERTRRRVLKKFPDANPKSIQLWFRAAKRKLANES